MKKERKKKKGRAVILGLGVNKEYRIQEDFWETQKIGRTSSLVGCTEYALTCEQSLNQNTHAESILLTESSEKP